MSENVHVLTDENFFETIKKGVVLVDFHAVWCAPCRMLSPIVEEVAEHFKGKALVAKIDIDSEQNVASQFKVTSVPTVILFKEGKEVNRLVGLRNAEDIKSAVEELL